jgi:hypothetical protein
MVTIRFTLVTEAASGSGVCSVISNYTGRLPRGSLATSATRSLSRSQLLNSVSIARLTNAQSHARLANCRRMRIAQNSLIPRLR